ncbi:MAG: aconitase X catalytic domain-containing protein [Reichenbachiella sp.]
MNKTPKTSRRKFITTTGVAGLALSLPSFALLNSCSNTKSDLTKLKVNLNHDNMKRHQLGGHIGTDPMFSTTTHTGHSRDHVKHSDNHPKMTLTAEEQEIYDGKKGDMLQKSMKTVVAYGELFGATKLVDLDCAPHMAMSWGSDGVEPFLKIYRQLADAGLKTYAPFTADPKPMDFDNIPMSDKEIQVANKIYNRMDELEEVNIALGMKKDNWSCACYLPQMGNTPKQGDNLAWSESSAINYSNSALGARTNRNSMGIDMLCSILGKAPYFGLLTDEGRQAKWLIDVRLTEKPHPEMIGSAIGLKVVEDVSYIIGMDKFIPEINEATSGYLKDFGAATASNGAVGLYHMEGVTPEAVKSGKDLLDEGYQTYVIDDAELKRIYATYPNLWKEQDGTPERVFLGCPHMSYGQMVEWGDRIINAMEKESKSKIAIPTYFFGSIFVKQDFEKRNPEMVEKLDGYGVSRPINCPMMWCSTPVAGAERVATNSNKTRVYTSARFFFDDVLTHLIVHGEMPPMV